jgi:hypothetical protein
MAALEAKDFGLIDSVLGDTSNIVALENQEPTLSFVGAMRANAQQLNSPQ